MYDTIIIGAGMSGLAAGIRLANFNQRVCILERHTTIGGLNSFYRLGGRNYDVGLHALTNYSPKGAKRGPLARLLKQLRFSWDDFSPTPQLGSSIAFPGATLRFTNDHAQLEAEIGRAFPSERAGYNQLVQQLVDYDDIGESQQSQSAREVLARYIRSPLLVEMLLCPLMFYGSAREHDMDFAQFSIMFRSIFFEGLARPLAGVRLILKHLTRRFKELGGELKLRAGVRQILSDGDEAAGVVLDDGVQLSARRVLSSAGWCETMRLCPEHPSLTASDPGQLSFTETISILDRQPQTIGHAETIVFFNDSDTFHWEKPPGLVDIRSGVICSPNNFAYDTPPPEGVMRITSLANFDRWNELPPDEYRQQKKSWYERVLTSAVRFVPDFRPHMIDTEMFTPTTIRRFTGHVNGAVYGSPTKHYSGQTHLKNLFVCGTDQGFVGIVGAIMSGIGIANKYFLTDPATAAPALPH